MLWSIHVIIINIMLTIYTRTGSPNKGGIDGPANAGALPRALRNAGPLFISSIPPT